jgi:hypothetical protein
MWLVWLFPLPPLLPHLDRQFWLLYPLPIAGAFFVPALAVAASKSQTL